MYKAAASRYIRDEKYLQRPGESFAAANRCVISYGEAPLLQNFKSQLFLLRRGGVAVENHAWIILLAAFI